MQYNTVQYNAILYNTGSAWKIWAVIHGGTKVTDPSLLSKSIVFLFVVFLFSLFDFDCLYGT